MKKSNQNMIDTYSGFNRFALKNGSYMCLKVWYWLRHFDIGNNGWIDETEVKKILNIIFYPSRTLQILRKGEGKWWAKSGKGFEIRSIKNVSVSLKCKPDNRVKIPEDAFLSNQKTKAYFYATFFSGSSDKYDKSDKSGIIGKTIARSTLTKVLGVSPRTQKRYESITSIKVYSMKSFIRYKKFNRKGILNKKVELRKKGQPYKILDINGDGIPELCWQLSNSYYVDTVIFAGNVNSRVKGLRGIFKRDNAKLNSYKRQYFYDSKALHKASKKAEYRNTNTYELASDYGGKQKNIMYLYAQS